MQSVPGKLCIEVNPGSKIAWISEELCIGCGICVKVRTLRSRGIGDPYHRAVKHGPSDLITTPAHCVHVEMPIRGDHDHQLAQEP